MKSKILLFPVLLGLLACGPGLPDEAVAVKVEPGDSEDQVMAKAVSVRPSARQAAAIQDDFIAFLHFGPNTFTGREWGTGQEDPAVFDLKHLDTDQWCRTLASAGMTKVVLTVKHHDGFVLYQTRYTKHGVMSSGFEGGKGDILRSLSESCARYGLKLGVYLSPADLRQMEDDGLYGNGSEVTLRTIPKAVEGRPFADKRTFQYEVDDYNEYFMSQLFELLTEYGPISEVWFDGAHPRRKGGQQYNSADWQELIRTLAPEAVIFNFSDIRWCGNEAGITRESEWNVLPFSCEDGNGLLSGVDAEDMGSREVLLNLPRPYWLRYLPGETDTSIRHGWFYRNDTEQAVRSADDVFDLYERTVGGNSILMLNVPPTVDGVLGDRDVATLTEVGRRIATTYGTNLCRKTLTRPTEVGEGIVLKLRRQMRVNRVMLSEPVERTGERIEAFAVDAWTDGGWQEVAAGGNVGHKRIVRFPIVTTDRIRVRVTASRAAPVLGHCSAHFYPEHPLSLSIRSDTDGVVTICPEENVFKTDVKGISGLNLTNVIHYTTDGSEPDGTSPVYSAPFKFALGTVKAVSVLGGEKGNTAVAEIGYDQSGWKVSLNPMDTVIDCGEEITMSGIRFVPNRNNFHGDYVSKASLSVSGDGRSWKKVADCEFGNIINDPSTRPVQFDSPVRGRYLRLDVLELVGDGDGFQSVDSKILILN